MLRQAINKIFIEGILAENDLAYGSYVKNGKTVESINGKIVVKVVQPINGVDKELMIPIHYFANKYKNDGNPNPVYTSLETAMNDYVSIAASDEENADRVRISSASLEMNEYYPTPDKLTSFPRLKASFINRVPKDSIKGGGQANGQIEMIIAGKEEEVVNDVPTGRILIKGIVPQYGGKVDVIPFYAASPKSIDFVSSNWNEGDTVPATIALNFSAETKEVIEEQAFGDPIVKTRTVNLSEILITGGNYRYDDDDAQAYKTDEVQAGLAERRARLEALKAKGGKKTAPLKSNTKLDLGF